MRQKGRPTKEAVLARLKTDEQIDPSIVSSKKGFKPPPPKSPNSVDEGDEPAWVRDAEARKSRQYLVNASDPVSLPDETTKAALLPPKEGEFTGSLRERGVQKELAAAIINVNTGTLTQWADGGSIRLTLDGFVPIPEIRRKIFEVHRGRSGVLSGSPDADSVSQAKLRGELAKAGGEELKFAEAKGEVVSRKAVALRWVDIAAMVKTRLLSIPGRLADDLVDIPDRHEIFAILTKEVTEALTSLSKPFSLTRKEEEDDRAETRRAGGSARKEKTSHDA